MKSARKIAGSPAAFALYHRDHRGMIRSHPLPQKQAVQFIGVIPYGTKATYVVIR